MNGTDQEGHRRQEKSLEITELMEGLRREMGIELYLKEWINENRKKKTEKRKGIEHTRSLQRHEASGS